MSTVQALIIRILPNPPTDPATFQNYLQDLTITAYDQSLVPVDPNVVTSGTTEWQLGSASVPKGGTPWIPTAFPPFEVKITPGASPNSPPVLTNSIFQHFQWSLQTPPADQVPAVLRSVATAIILINIDPKAPNPYPEYPGQTYNVRIALNRAGVALPDPPIQWGIQSVSLSIPPTDSWFVEEFGINESNKIATLNAINTSSTMYILLPNPPPPLAPTSTTIILPTNGTPPKFDDLVNAVNPVLIAYNLQGAASLASLTVALTDNQCQNIAQAIMNNQALQQLPVPIPKFPSQTDASSLEDMYSSPSSSKDSPRKQFEGNLAAYHAKTDSTAQKLAPYIFAASAAVYAENQTTIAQTASFNLPLFNGTSVPITLTGSNAPLSPSFIVPAAYFYALCADNPATMDAPLRYTDILGKAKSTDYLYQKIRTAQSKGILNSSETAITSKTTSVTDVSAVLRLAALATTSLSGTDPILPLAGSVAALVSGWLANPPTTISGQSSFFTQAEFASQPYLQVIFQVVTKGPYPSNFINAITNTALVPVVPKSDTLRKIQTASDLPLVTNKGWLLLFESMAVSDPVDVPAWLGNGSQNQSKAFMRWIQTLFTVGFQAQPATNATGGNVGSLGTDFSSDVLFQFFTLYNKKYPNFDFSKDLIESNVADILSDPDFSDPELQDWMKHALSIIRTLYILTTINDPKLTPNLQFSYMESLYSRGFISLESVSMLSSPQFKSALTGTIAYSVSDAIHSNASTATATLPLSTGLGFQPCNPGSLVNCIPPPNLSPFGRIEYLHEILQISSGNQQLGNIISARRGHVESLQASLLNLETQVCAVDLINESLESLGSNLTKVQGAVYNTVDEPVIGFDHKNKPFPTERAVAVIPQNSSPSPSILAPAVYDVLKTCFTSPLLPYSQTLDVCRSYLCRLGTDRFDTMRTFRQNITEFPLALTAETTDFQREQWRLPVRFDIALEYIQISLDEYSTLWSTTISTGMIAQLYGINLTTDALLLSSLLTVPGFTKALGLNYCEFLDLWRCGIVKFTRVNSNSRNADLSSDDSSIEFPSCPPCCLDGLVLAFDEDEIDISLGKIALFIRLWRKLQQRCQRPLSMNCLADIFLVFKPFIAGKELRINPDFIRQVASLVMFVDLFDLPWKINDANSTAVGVRVGAERTQLLGIWLGPSSTSWNWAIKAFLVGIEKFAIGKYKCAQNTPEFAKILAENLDELSNLAGFSPTNTWYSTPTCTIRFAEVLAKIYASEFTVGELLFLFTTLPHLEGDDPFPIEKSKDDPFAIPEDKPYRLEHLRRKLLDADICDEEFRRWDWYLVESTLNEAGFNKSSNGGSNELIVLAQHFFPDILSSCGYHVPPEKRRFTASLPSSSTSPHMWTSPPCEPFHYSYDSNSNSISNSNVNDESQNSQPGQLWTQLPFNDSAVLAKLRALRQLNPAEILAVRNLYFTPRAILAPFALVFSNFGHAEQHLISEPSEDARFDYFRKEVALFHRRCEIITDHLMEHVSSATCFDNEERAPIEREVVWKILKSLIADENLASTSWENDSGLPPTHYMCEPHFSGSSLAALLGLIGTGLAGQYDIDKSATWLEMRGGLTAFGRAENDWNTPIPTVIPALNIKPTQTQDELVSFKNGMMLRDADGKEFGGAQAFTITWTGLLIIDKPGHYRFGAGRPAAGNCMPGCSSDNSWTVTLGRGHKIWTILKGEGTGTASSSHVSSSVPLQKGTYDISVTFEQHVPVDSRILEHDGVHHLDTGFQLKYDGPDSDGYPIEVPICQLIRASKDGPFRVSEKDIFGTAAQYLKLQYTSTIRDIRRTYQRAFKACLFCHRFRLSASKTYCDHQSELGYLLAASDRFAGTAYYTSSTGMFQSHHANFDFNFLPVADSYQPPDPSIDSRVAPSPQRQAALFDWFERIFDYTILRKDVHNIGKRQIWLLFQDISTQNPTALDNYTRYLGINIDLAPLALRYFASSDYQVAPADLLDERWVVRLWHVRDWIYKLSKNFYTTILDKAKPSLWASDDPTIIIGSESGNQNLVSFTQESSLFSKNAPRSLKALKDLNDGLRIRAREALLAYLCGMSRVTISFTGVSSFVKKPSDLSDLLLQDVEARITKKISRIDDAILSVQNFIQRARIGLETSFILDHKFVKLWDDRFSRFDNWVAWKRRVIYKENWIQWEELQKLQSFEGPKFLKDQLKELTSTIVEPGKPMWWAGNNFPAKKTIEPLQDKTIASFGLEQGSDFEGFSLIGTPGRDARPSLLAAGLVFASANTTSDTTVKAAKATATTAQQTTPLDNAGLGTLESIPLWVQAAIRIGTQFVRVAAAGVPTAFSYKKSKDDGSACCAECALIHDDVVDEYYFWLQDSKYFDDNDAAQDPSIGAQSATDPTTDWEKTDDPKTISNLLYWPPKPLLHLAWSHVHMGRLDPPRRSDEGVAYDPGSYTPQLSFLGRQIDSLSFTAVVPNPNPTSNPPVTPLFTGFRYDIATDTAVATPILNGNALPAPTTPAQPTPLTASPRFAYFEPGKPLIPVSSFGISLAMGAALRSNCQFESSLRWCQLDFDPLVSDNTWSQCPKKGDQLQGTSSATDTRATTLFSPKAATQNTNPPESAPLTSIQLIEPNIGHKSRSTSSSSGSEGANLPPHPSSGLEVSAKKSTEPVITPATTPGVSSTERQLESESPIIRDTPCCPSSPVSKQVAMSRAVVLEYLKTLLLWGDRLLQQNTMEASHQSLIVFNTMDWLLGPRPKYTNAHDRGITAMSVANFVASPAPLNPELLRLYDAVIDRKTLIRENENAQRLHDESNHVAISPKMQTDWLPFQNSTVCEVYSCQNISRCKSYRFTSLLPKAMDAVNMVKGLGASLLSAYEKGDSEYLAAFRAAQDRKILDLGLTSAQNAWRASDWDVQALYETMQSAVTRLQYYQDLLNGGLSSGESGYQLATQTAMQSQNASNVAEGTAQAANIIPDLAFGVAGLGPYESTTIPIGQKLANAASTSARVMSMIAQISNGNGSLQLTQSGWTRRSQDWQNQVNVIQIEIQQIKSQILAGLRRRDSALRELNDHQQQMDHSAEVQDFMRDKLTKHELYLFLQQETSMLYRQAYSLAEQIARDAQDAFRFERGNIEENFFSNLKWDSLHEGLMSGERLEMSLRSMERTYMDTNCREYELTKHISAKLQLPEAFLNLKTCGECEIDIPEWCFDLDYPGHYMRRIKSMTLSIACVAGPYTSINCRIQILSNAIRVKPLLVPEEECCCDSKEKTHYCNRANDPYVVKQYVATEAISTSRGQDDSGLFQLDFKDERYLPFEYKGAVSRWRIELPPENNQFDIASLTDVVLHLNYTAREGGQELRKAANACAQQNLPGDGIRFFDIRHDFPDAWRILKMDGCKDKYRDWPLRFNRSMFPFLVGNRAVRVTCIHLFIQVSKCCPGEHICVGILPAGEKGDCREENFVCAVGEACGCTFCGKIEVDFGPISGNCWHNFGHLRFGNDLKYAEEAYMLCEYKVDCADDNCKCKRCCAPDLGSRSSKW